MPHDPNLVEEMKRMEERARGRPVPKMRTTGDRDRNELQYLIEKMRRLEHILGRNPHPPIKVYCDNVFPILALPDKLITKVLSYLSIEDRLKIRMNKRLNAIELESRCFVQNLTIGELPEDDLLEFHSKKKELPYATYRNDQEIMFKEGETYSVEILRRMAKNTSIGQLTIKLVSRFEFIRKTVNFIIEFDINHLIIDFKEDPEGLPLVKFNESILHKLANACKRIEILSRNIIIDGPDTYELYEGISDGRWKLRSFEMWMCHAELQPLLMLIGVRINFENRQILAIRDCEAFIRRYAGGEDELLSVHIFFERFELSLSSKRDEAGKMVKLELHESEEALEKARGAEYLMRFY